MKSANQNQSLKTGCKLAAFSVLVYFLGGDTFLFPAGAATVYLVDYFF